MTTLAVKLNEIFVPASFKPVTDWLFGRITRSCSGPVSSVVDGQMAGNYEFRGSQLAERIMLVEPKEDRLDSVIVYGTRL